MYNIPGFEGSLVLTDGVCCANDENDNNDGGDDDDINDQGCGWVMMTMIGDDDDDDCVGCVCGDNDDGSGFSGGNENGEYYYDNVGIQRRFPGSPLLRSITIEQTLARDRFS